MANVDRYRSGKGDLRQIDVLTSTSVVEIGDQLIRSSGLAIRQTAATDNVSFLGVAHRAHQSGDSMGKGITYYAPGDNTIFEFPLDTATDIDEGDELAWSAAQELTKTATDATFVATETKDSATTILCKMKIKETEIGDAS